MSKLITLYKLLYYGKFKAIDMYIKGLHDHLRPLTFLRNYIWNFFTTIQSSRTNSNFEDKNWSTNFKLDLHHLRDTSSWKIIGSGFWLSSHQRKTLKHCNCCLPLHAVSLMEVGELSVVSWWCIQCTLGFLVFCV